MIDSTRWPGAPNALPASDQPRFAAAVVGCANTPRRLQESPSRRRAHAGADKIGRAVGTLLNRRQVANTPITDHALSLMHDHAAIAAEVVGVRCTRARCGRRTAIITSGYRLHGVTSFPIRRAEFHASPVPAHPAHRSFTVLCETTLLSPADGGNPPWSLAVSQAANPDQNHRTGSPRDSTSSTISRCLRPAPRRGSSPRTGLSR